MPHGMACRILVPRTGIKLALEGAFLTTRPPGKTLIFNLPSLFLEQLLLKQDWGHNMILYLLGLDNPGIEIVIKSPQNIGGYVLSIKGGRQRVLWDHGGSTWIQSAGSR